jgi:diaminopimelate decarboxylase
MSAAGAATERDRRGWPAALTCGSSGALQLDGVELAALVRERGTPVWAISRSTVEHNFDELLGAFRARYENCEIAFSMKAHNTLAVVQVLHGRGAKLDCSAEYELAVVRELGVPAGDIILNGCGKSGRALAAAAEHGVREVNVDSLDEARRLEVAAREAGTVVNCTVRVQLGFERLLERDPSYLSAARAADKFGSDAASGEAMEVVRAVVGSPHLAFVGLHHHVVFPGYLADYSTERALAHHAESAAELCEFANEVRSELNVDVERLNLGGGIRASGSINVAPLGQPEDPVWYELPSAAAFADAVFGAIEQSFEGDERPLVQFESGGHMVWDAVVLLSRVSEVKHTRRRGGDPLRYVYVDASAMQFVVRSMLKMAHPVLLVERPAAPPATPPADLVGQTCLTDTIAERLPLPELEAGDLLCLLHQGAYCDTTSTQVNSFPRPEVVLVADGAATVVKRRETLEDVHARDVPLPV